MDVSLIVNATIGQNQLRLALRWKNNVITPMIEQNQPCQDSDVVAMPLYFSFLSLKGRLDTLDSREKGMIIKLGHCGHPNQLRLLRLRSFLRPHHCPDHRAER